MNIPGMAPGVHEHVSGYTPNSRISGTLGTRTSNSVRLFSKLYQFSALAWKIPWTEEPG